VPAEQIDKRYYDSPYYVFPNDNVGQEAFAVIRDAMKGKGVVALGRIVLARRERVIALEPFEKGLLGTTLRYAYEVRSAADAFDDIEDVKISGEMLKLAEHIVETKVADFDPSQFVDHYETALTEMLRKKQQGFQPPKGKERPTAPNVVNLMDALRQSIAAGRRTPPAEKAADAPAKKGKKKVEGQREMLLPIEGKKQKEVAKKAAAKPAARQRRAG
jgi:DNA end-binding protein Ku